MSIAPPDDIRRIVYLGTPELATAPLRALVEAGYEIDLVVTRPDARRGRGRDLSPSPVKAAALELGLPVSHDLADIDTSRVELAVVVAYGRIVPTSLLDELAFVNLHFSLLPRWRGAAPVERAILADDEITGVCVMDIEPELDTGAIYAQATTGIDDDDSLESLRSRLVQLGIDELLGCLQHGFATPTPQEGEPVYAAKITADDCRIDWAGTARSVHAQVRVGNAFTMWNNKRLKVHRSRLGVWPGDGIVVNVDGQAITLIEVQPEGKPRMAARDWANGARWSPDQPFDS